MTYGFFSGRDILGVPDPRLCDLNFSPPRCYHPPSQFGVLVGGPFTNQDIYEDLQFCGTSIDMKTYVASGGALDSARVGSGGTPGRMRDRATLRCPTRGTIQLGGTIAAMTCFTTDTDADDEIIVALNGTDVLTLRRPSGGDEYLRGTPADIDIIHAAEDAGITPMEGTTHDLTIRRSRTECSDLLWGDQTFTLLTTTLAWENPTLETEVQMPSSVTPGETVNVDVWVRVIDQLGQAGFFDAINLVLQSAGGTLSQSIGQTDLQGYFHTSVTVSDPLPLVNPRTGERVAGLQVDATATSFEGVTAQGTATATVQGAHAEFEEAWHSLQGRAVAAGGLGSGGCTANTPCTEEDPIAIVSHEWGYANSADLSATCGGAMATATMTMNSGTDAQAGGSTFTRIDGDVVTQASAIGDASYVAAINTPTAESSSLWTFNVIGGTLNYSLTGSGVASGSAQVGGVFLKLTRLNPDNSGSLIHDFFGTGTWNESGSLTPGRYRIQVATNADPSAGCEDSQTKSGSANMTFILSVPR